MASNRRIDVPEKVGGPALHVNAERLGRDRDGELFSDGRRGGSPAIPRRPESRVRSMRRPGRFEDGPGRRRAHSDGRVVSALEDEENLGDRLACLDGEDETMDERQMSFRQLRHYAP